MEKPTCEQLRQELQDLKNLKKEFDLEYQKAVETGNLARTRELKSQLEEKRNALEAKLWVFEGLSQKKFKEDYEKTISGYREFGWLKPLSSGQEGIIGDNGKEYPIPSIQEIRNKLMADKEFFAEKFAVMENPRVHLTPFALSPEAMKDNYAALIESHFVEERVEGDKRIPNENKTRLFGSDNKPLPLRTDRQNVYFGDSLKNLLYFPEWEEKGGVVKPKGGLTKEEAIDQIGGWRVIIIDDIPKAPEKGEAKLLEKEIRIKGKAKKVKREQVEGGMNAAEQYDLLKKQKEEGLVLEDWISIAALYLKENNKVLDDDKGTNYYCRLLGACTAVGFVPSANWVRDGRRACLVGNIPEHSYSDNGVRASVRVG